jgi:hypothetical protein
MEDKILENKIIGPWQILAIQNEHRKIIDLYIIRNDISNQEALRVHELFGIDTGEQKAVASRIKVLSNELTILLHEVVEDATATCLLCNAPMVMRTGKFGTFYACSKGHDTGCICTVDSTGRPSKKTKTALAMKRPKATTELDKLLGQNNIQKRIAKIEID